MKYNVINVFCGIVIAALCGCVSIDSGSGEAIMNIEDCKVMLSGTRTMKEVVVAAAHGKMWMPEERGANTVRCTLDVCGFS